MNVVYTQPSGKLHQQPWITYGEGWFLLNCMCLTFFLRVIYCGIFVINFLVSFIVCGIHSILCYFVLLLKKNSLDKQICCRATFFSVFICLGLFPLPWIRLQKKILCKEICGSLSSSRFQRGCLHTQFSDRDG